MSERSIVHLEISAKDSAVSSKFYSDVFGWKIEVDPNFNYYQFKADGTMGLSYGAFVQADGQMYKAGEIIPYIGTDEIDRDLSKIEALGGKTVQPSTEIPGVGWFAFFQDPAGNRMGLFKTLPR